MNKELEYWKWKNTIIDFDNISDEKDEYGSYATKKDIVFHYLGTPDNDIHEWYNGGFSSEYNTALRYAKQLGLVENYIDYEEELYTLKQENKELEEYITYWQKETDKRQDKIDKAIEYMKPRFMNCIDNDKRYFADVYIQEIYEILKDSDVDD